MGFDAGEPQRMERMAAKNPQPPGQPPHWHWRAPLTEWDLDRDDCVALLKKAGLPQPGKSSCFMCPSMKKPEILKLAETHPELMAKALRIEDAAIEGGELRNVKGLGRNYSWRQFLEGHPEALAAVDSVEEECACVDD